MCVLANLVEFVLSVDGAQVDHSWAVCTRFLLVACACLLVGVQLMSEYREEELRRGIQRRCQVDGGWRFYYH
ncbi:hypothetical protein B0F90DRAFT_1753313 [Multifurca ochricompacta]|uniref:Uncharacterized protein n=1 Tax=Multifurca ochricompacta TaxID=376703 RepID=A0AAD4LZ16_9AGAM|nr:hypothetical protein B0F90DRAFT_1753313 [Multifurca ochricompacta]